jgi:anti-anti-sigma regulatory factor
LGEQLVVRLIGDLDVEHLDEVRAQVSETPFHVVVDIGELTLISVEGIRFLNTCQTNGTPIINASGYIAEWMALERGARPNQS